MARATATNTAKTGARAKTSTATPTSTAATPKPATRGRATGKSAAGAKASGRASTPDIIALLKQDHAHVKDLFKKFGAMSERAAKGRKATVDKVVRELSMHAAVEEQVVYPAIRQNVPDGAGLADHAVEEHQMAKDLLAKLDAMDPSDPQLAPTMKQLVADVKQHIKEEEGQMLPKLRASVDRAALRRMGEMARMAKKTAPTRPHPKAPNTPPGNLVAGPVAGVVDRVADVATGRGRKRAGKAR